LIFAVGGFSLRCTRFCGVKLHPSSHHAIDRPLPFRIPRLIFKSLRHPTHRHWADPLRQMKEPRPRTTDGSPKQKPRTTRGAWRTPEGCRGAGDSASVTGLMPLHLNSSAQCKRSAERSRHPSALAPHSASPRSPPVLETSCEKMAKSRHPNAIKKAVALCPTALHKWHSQRHWRPYHLGS
jgi:hypothetical protein